MKNILIFSWLLFFSLFSETNSFCSEDYSPSVEKGYFGATVLLIDHKTGDIGVRIEDDDTGKLMDLAFKVDIALVTISDSRNEVIDFSDIQSGDIINFYTESDKTGKESITEITDTSRLASEL